MLRFAAMISCAALVSCAGARQSADGPSIPNLPPNYREVIAEHAKKTFFDPYTIRDASISNPVDSTSIFGAVTNVCVKANAKNRMGAYVGIKSSGYVFQAGKILNVLDDELVAGSCASRSYVPFYEIDSVAKPPAPEAAKPNKRSGRS